MVPLSTLATITPIGRPRRGLPLQPLPRDPAAGHSGAGILQRAGEQRRWKKWRPRRCRQGFGYEWTGTTYQEKQAQGNEGAIFGFAAVLVFLFLAALYESWSIPFAVLFALPLGMFGALAGVYLRSYPYDIYTQIGIVTLIGLAAKNAILIVEFAKESHEHGKNIRDAAIEAAHLRLRPILMTSFAFILGVLPLVLATGASSGARRSLGTAVFSGMLSATLLAIFIVPVLYVIIESFVERRTAVGRFRAACGAGPMNAMKRTILAVSVLALSGCMMGPNYQRPQVALPGGVPRRAASRRHWPHRSPTPSGRICFPTRRSNQMVDTALAHNFDLRIAAERVEEARFQLGITRANQYPFVDAQAGFTGARSSASGRSLPVPPGTNLSASFTSLGAALSWELDIWGRLRRQTEAARATYLASEEGRRAVGVSLVSDVMESYFQLLEQDLELEISQKTLGLANDSLKLVELRRQRGAASGLDVSQAEQLIHTAGAQMRGRGTDHRAKREHAESAARQRCPSAQARGRKLEEIPMPAQLPPGLPSALLERRPDIREAEQNLVAANAQIGAARALYFPQLSLGAFVGGQSRGLSALGSPAARVYNVAPSAVQSIFQRGTDSQPGALERSAAARVADCLPALDLYRAARGLRCTGQLRPAARAAQPGGATGAHAGRHCAALGTALSRRAGQLPAGAGRAAKSLCTANSRWRNCACRNACRWCNSIARWAAAGARARGGSKGTRVDLRVRPLAVNGNFPPRGFRTGPRRLRNTMRSAHRARSKDLW